MQMTQMVLEDIVLEVAIEGRASDPLVILLHGFPESAASWREWMSHLAAANLLVVAPNQRGYAGSDKPSAVRDYDLDILAADVTDLVEKLGRKSYAIIGHDWGAAVGWWVATTRPAGLKAFCALSAPHPAVWRSAMQDDPEQRRLSRYVKFMKWPILPEFMLRLGGFKALKTALSDSGLDADQIESFQQEWRRPGALTGMVNWYRALLAHKFHPVEHYPLSVPTLFFHGERDPYMLPRLGETCSRLWPSIERYCIPEAGHWINHTNAGQIMPIVSNFLAERMSA